MTQLTFNTAQINDAARPDGRLWEVGTLRVFHKGDRQYWSVCQKGCDNYGTALNCWGADGGEFFDGAQWRPLAQQMREYALQEIEAQRQQKRKPNLNLGSMSFPVDPAEFLLSREEINTLPKPEDD